MAGPAQAAPRGELALRGYDSVDGVAQRLAKTNPRLARDQAGRDKADWLARHWARQNAQGQWEILGDAAHKIVNAQLLRVDETAGDLQAHHACRCWRSRPPTTRCGNGGRAASRATQYHERLQHVPDHRIAVVQDAGHMLHHDQPEQLARLLEDFLAAEPPPARAAGLRHREKMPG